MFNKLILPWRYMILRSQFRKLLRMHMNPQTLTGVPRSSKFHVFTRSQLLWCKIMFNKFSRDVLLLKIGHIGNLASTFGISIGIDVGIGTGILRSLSFCFSKFYMKKTSVVKYFSSTLADLPGSFKQCLEQLFCGKPVRTSIWRKELHSRRYLRSFKNTQGLYISEKEPHQRSLPGNQF